MKTLIGVTSGQLTRAADILKQKETLERELATLLGGASVGSVGVAQRGAPRGKSHKMTDEGRAAISKAQKKRWRAFHAAKAA